MSENFVYVYQLPEKLTNGFCMKGGVPIIFDNVDWFEDNSGCEESLINFIKQKRYIRSGRRYLILKGNSSFII
jgi:hypothetical protein